MGLRAIKDSLSSTFADHTPELTKLRQKIESLRSGDRVVILQGAIKETMKHPVEGRIKHSITYGEPEDDEILGEPVDKFIEVEVLKRKGIRETIKVPMERLSKVIRLGAVSGTWLEKGDKVEYQDRLGKMEETMEDGHKFIKIKFEVAPKKGATSPSYGEVERIPITERENIIKKIEPLPYADLPETPPTDKGFVEGIDEDRPYKGD